MARGKGDASFEVSNGVGYFGKNSAGNYTWLKLATDTSSNYVTSWNNDYQLYGHGSLVWFKRGGAFDNGGGAGVFSMSSDYGGTYMPYGFRPVLVSGGSL